MSKARPELADKLQRTRDAMDRAVPDCLVTNYEGLIDCVTLPDANDLHVVVAAIVGRADVIVTFNLALDRLDQLGDLVNQVMEVDASGTVTVRPLAAPGP